MAKAATADGKQAAEGSRRRGKDNQEPGIAPAPPLLLVHGFAQDGRSWEEVGWLFGASFSILPLSDFPEKLQANGGDAAIPPAPESGDDFPRAAGFPAVALAAQTSVGSEKALYAFAVDLPGAGTMAHEADPALFSLDAVAAQIRTAARALKTTFGAAPVAVGYSQGGRILLQALTTANASQNDGFPLSGLLLESAGLGPANQTDRTALAKRSRQWASRARADGTAAFMDWWEQLPLFASQRQLPDEQRVRLREGRLQNSPEALALSLEGMGQHHQAPAQETTKALENLIADQGIPVVFVSGSLDQKYSLVGAQLQERFATQPLFAWREVPRAGHNVHYEAPWAFTDILKSLIGLQPSFPQQ